MGSKRLIDLESGLESDDYPYQPFSDILVRKMFIMKVYGILSCQLGVTFTFCAVIMLVKPINEYARESSSLLWLSLVLYFLTSIPLICCKQLQRTVPWNYILLMVFTMSLSFMVAMVCTFYTAESVLLALGITMMSTFTVSILSCITKFDFTKLTGVMCIVLFIFFIAGISLCFMPYSLAHTFYAVAGAIIFMIFLAIDTQTMIGGGRYEISPEDYIFACLQLYLDIVQIFLYILRLVGQRSD